MFGPGTGEVGVDHGVGWEIGEAEMGPCRGTKQMEDRAASSRTRSQLALCYVLDSRRLGTPQLCLRGADSWLRPDQLYIGATW